MANKKLILNNKENHCLLISKLVLDILENKELSLLSSASKDLFNNIKKRSHNEINLLLKEIKNS